MLRVVDQLMYQVKLQGKDAILYANCRGILDIAYPPENPAPNADTHEPTGDATGLMV